MAWDPAQYLKFAGHRVRPPLDLLARIPVSSPGTVVDLGAGTGNVTRLLRERWPETSITAVERSPEMIAKARSVVPAGARDMDRNIEWVQADLGQWRPPAPVDVIFSNAALHWLEGHDALFPRLLAMLRPGGVLAVQMPRNFEAPSHTAMAAAAHDGPWREVLEPLLRPAPVAAPAFYYDLLVSDCDALDIWESEYLQVLEGENPVREWTKGTWLRPLLDALEEPARSDFEKAYGDLIAEAYPKRPDGRTLFPFRRLFVVATRRAA